MPEDLYNDGPSAGGGTPPEAPMPSDDSKDGGKSAILPKSCFPNAKPGDTLSVTVKRVNENDLEVEPQGGESEHEEAAPDSEAAESDQNGSPMRSMLED